MTAKAMGPQKTVKAIGIMPSTVAAALSRMGRMRLEAAAMTASHACTPSRRSVSICSIRITALLATSIVLVPKFEIVMACCATVCDFGSISQTQDRLAGAHDLAGFGTDLGDGSGRIGAKRRVVEPILRHLLLGLGGVEPRLRADVSLLRLVEVGARREAFAEQRLLGVESIAGLGQHGARFGHRGARGA
jgi:hypothetical protein